MQISSTDRAEFQSFYQGLKERTNIFYMYFTSNLLHYAMESVSLVPVEINLVILSSGLSEEECRCTHRFFGRPHLNFSTKYHDTCIWDMLHRETKGNFGWLDVDCFVYNPELFCQMMDLTEDVALNATWARPYDYYGVDGLFANTYFLYVNSKILKAMTEKYPEISLIPRVFSDLEGEPIYGNYKYLTEEETRVLKERYPGVIHNPKGYDTTHHYQIMLRAEGHGIRRIRELNQLATYYSKELLHLGGCYRIHEATLDKGLRRVYFRFNMRYSYYLLHKYARQLPRQYDEFQRSFAENMKRNKLSTDIDDVLESVMQYAERNGIETSHIGVNAYDGF